MDGLYNDRKAAYHEAAHAVIALYHGFPVRCVSINSMGGGTTLLAWWHQFFMRFSGIKHIPPYIEYIMAGQAGEMLVRRQEDKYKGSHEDQYRAEYMRMIWSIPRGDFGAMRYRVSEWVSDRRELIKAIGERLLIEHKISGRELKFMMNDFHNKYPHFAELTRD